MMGHEVDYIRAGGLVVASCGCGWESVPAALLSYAVVSHSEHRRTCREALQAKAAQDA